MTIYHDVAGTSVGVTTQVPMLPNTREGEFYHKIRSFLDAVKTGGKAPVPSSQIVYNQAIIDGIVKSGIAGKEIEIKIPKI